MLDIRPASDWRYANRMDIKPSMGLRKCLFAKPVPETENLQTDLRKLTAEMQKADKERWNFDFIQNKPLPVGRYQWEKMAPGSSRGESAIQIRYSDHLDSSGETESDISFVDSPSLSSPGGSGPDTPSTQRSLSGW